MTHRNYEVSEYNKMRPAIFHQEANTIKELLDGLLLSIKHIGSTSIPGMQGKNTIDILCVIEHIDYAVEVINRLVILGYTSLGKVHDNNSYILEKYVGNERTFIIQLLPKDHIGIEEIYTIKEFLLNNYNEVVAYGEYKMQLFEKFHDNYKLYRQYKNIYMTEMKNRAQIWKKGAR